MARLVTAAAFLHAAKLRTKEVDIGNGDTVLVRELSLAERRDFHEVGKSDDGFKLQAWVATRVVIDDDGVPVLKAGDVAALEEARQDILQRIVEECLVLSGLMVRKEKEGDAKND